MSKIRKRAVSPEQKEQRRLDILASARDLFDQSNNYDSLLMKHIAENIDLTKGTLYLYFKTKEEVFLALYMSELKQVSDAIDSDLQALADGNVEFGVLKTVHSILCQHLLSEQRFLRLTSLLHVVLEQNIDLDTALSFKQVLRSGILQTGALIEAVIPELREGQGAEILLGVQEILIGCFQAATPTACLEPILERPEMQFMKLDFETEFHKLLKGLLFSHVNRDKMESLFL